MKRLPVPSNLVIVAIHLVIIILSLLKGNLCNPRWPQHTHYYIVLIIVAGKKMHDLEMKYTEEFQKLPSEESHPVTDPPWKRSRNPSKEQETSVLKANKIQ